MRIAIAANFDKKVAIDSRGGSEVFTYLQANELAKRNSVEKIFVFGVGKNYFDNNKISFISLLPEETQLFTSKTSLLEDLINRRPEAYSQIEGAIGIKLFSLIQPYLSEIDIFQNNSTSSVFNSFISLITKPTITTLHTNADSPSILIPYSLGLFNQTPHHYFVRIANHQDNFVKKNNLKLNIVKTIYNGIDTHLNLPEYGTKNSENGFWLGRISQKHDKGIKEAIQATNFVQKKLFCLVTIDDESYFQKEVLPQSNKNIIINDKVITFAEKISLYQNASYFLYPIMWEEPFGLVLTEAMACGTPVIAFAKGAVPEIIKDGETGYIVNSSPTDIRGDWIIKKTGIEGLCEAIKRISALSGEQYMMMRRTCRKHVESNFSVEKMGDGYEKIYNEILQKQ